MNGKIVSLGGIAAAVLIASGIGFAGSRGGLQLGGMPLFVVCGGAGFLIQWLCFVPAFIYQTERFYDLVGSLTYISMATTVLVLADSLDGRKLLIGALVIIWAARLGFFLYSRVREDGHDSRFVRIKPNFLQFLMTWTLQGLWVFVTFAAGLAAMTTAHEAPLGTIGLIGTAVWMSGFFIEVVADQQKRAFRREPANKTKFIQHGLWALSRHPNYFGEILLWIGIAIIAYPVLAGWQLITLISPVFVFCLLTFVSGVRMLEHRANRRWGEDPGYQAYRARTPVLILKPWA